MQSGAGDDALGGTMIGIEKMMSAIVLGLCAAVSSAMGEPIFAELRGEVLLDNPRVLVEKYVLQPGQSTGRQSHPGDQLWVFIKGGVLTSRATGRATLWRDGRVEWFNATDRVSDGATNTGGSPIEIDLVTLKPVPASTAPLLKPKYHYLNYPNIPGEDLLENDSVIVQRFTVMPGQWEGVHAHHPDMLYIHIKGGQWAARTYKDPERPSPQRSPDGEVGWMATIDLAEGHESRNIGTEPIDLVWVTLKK
jgi:quercetin dioxygenase-like cupin family protein